MANHNQNGFSDQKHQRAAEIQDPPVYGLLAASESNPILDDEIGPELSLQDQEYKGQNYDDVALRAHGLWEERGRPEGSPDEDWFRAIEQYYS